MIDAVAAGDNLETAAAHGGVCSATVRNWLRAGVQALACLDESGDLPDKAHAAEFAEFAKDFLRAEAGIKTRLFGIVLDHAEHDGRLALSVLEKRWPTEYGDGQIRRAIDEIVATVEDVLGVEAAERVFAAIGGEAPSADTGPSTGLTRH